MILSQVAGLGQDIIHWAVIGIVVIVALGIAVIIARLAKFNPPEWFVLMFWLFLAGAVGIILILVLCRIAGLI